MLNLILSPYGAISRMQYFKGILYIILLGTLLMFLWSFGFTALIEAFDQNPRDFELALGSYMNACMERQFIACHIPPIFNLSSILMYAFFNLVGIFFIWASTCLQIKRLRDLAVSPWLLVIIWIPTFLMYIPTMTNISALHNVSFAMITIFNLILLFYPSRLKDIIPKH
jgi:uncharacterized membrane protein YhaH (DUF805 family)